MEIKWKYVIVVSIFIIGMATGFLYANIQKEIKADDKNLTTDGIINTTEELANYIRDNNISYKPYTIYKQDGSVDIVVPDGMYFVEGMFTIESGILKYIDNSVWINQG